MGALKSRLHLGRQGVGFLFAQNALKGDPIGCDELDGGKGFDVEIIADLRSFGGFDQDTDEPLGQLDDLLIAKGPLQHLLTIEAFGSAEKDKQGFPGLLCFVQGFGIGAYEFNAFGLFGGGLRFCPRRSQEPQGRLRIAAA